MHRIVLAVLLACGSAAHAASLRTHTLLHGPDVRLSDLFDDAGPKADRRLGPAPAPGGRIVVEAAQLGAIAKQFGVEWRPSSSGDRAELERPGRLLPREAVLDAVRGALQSAGASADCEIELPGFVPPLVPAEAEPHLTVSQLDYDRAAGRFAAVLSVTGETMEPMNLRLAGRAEDTVELPVATTRLPAGTVLSDGDVHLGRVRVSLLRGEVAHRLGDAVGMQLRRPALPGQPLGRADLARPAQVLRGSSVQIELTAGGLSVTGKGTATESGAAGERIHVMNSGSHAVIEAVVTGPGQVRVVPSAVPVLAASREQVLR
jgi:flagella basal body P-ring formation protein FlgA